MLLILFLITGVHNFPSAPPYDITPPIVSVQPRHVHLALGEQKNTGCPTKNDTLFWRAVAPLNFELGIKVGGVLESSGSQL